MKLEVGDWVECIDVEYFGDHMQRLTLGAVYKVRAVYYDEHWGEDMGGVQLEGINQFHNYSATRFKKVKSKIEIKLV